MQSKKARNLTRYTYQKTAFQGWRVSICRRQRQFTRYFSDKACGSEEESFRAAVELRDRILEELRAAPADVDAVFARHR